MADTIDSRLTTLGVAQTVAALVDAMAARLDRYDSPQTEARELLAALLDVPRYWPSLRANRWVEAHEWARAMAAADKRARGMPQAYAAGHANFRGLTLDVDERVLIPRPETELLVDLVLDMAGDGGVVVDVGTGSGAIAISLAREGSFDRVIATDVSADALAVAEVNVSRCEARVELRPGHLLKPLRDLRSRVRAVVSNPPYIAFHEIDALPRDVRDWEPMTALVSGDNGLALTAQLVRDAHGVLETGGLLALEVDSRRASLVAEHIAAAGSYNEIAVHLDLAGRERMVTARKAAPTEQG